MKENESKSDWRVSFYTISLAFSPFHLSPLSLPPTHTRAQQGDFEIDFKIGMAWQGMLSSSYTLSRRADRCESVQNGESHVSPIVNHPYFKIERSDLFSAIVSEIVALSLDHTSPRRFSSVAAGI